MALAPGSTIGILGGGQLGRMLSLAASRLGFETHIYCPQAGGPAAQVSTRETNGDYLDLAAIKTFAKACDVVTYEFENVPAATAMEASQHAPLRPGALALDVAQDRLTEKTFLKDKAKVAVIAFSDVTSIYDAKRAIKKLGLPAVIKTRRLGYDGKGQAMIKTQDSIAPSFAAMAGAPAIMEQFAPFKREVSIIAARGVDGSFAAYPLIENVHRNHILHSSTCPAPYDSGAAQDIARAIMEALDYVGVMATEFFDMSGRGAREDLIVNEIAPRVHNSGHFTQNAGCCDQFEQHIRAIAGWPLGSTMPLHKTVMTNLIGADASNWENLAHSTHSHMHLYGKGEASAGRKMGHINETGETLPRD